MQPDDQPRADVEILASAAADGLRFHSEPEVRVSFPGTGERESRQVTTREHIDTPVQPGRTYHRVFVTTRISSRLVALTFRLHRRLDRVYPVLFVDAID